MLSTCRRPIRHQHECHVLLSACVDPSRLASTPARHLKRFAGAEFQISCTLQTVLCQLNACRLPTRSSTEREGNKKTRETLSVVQTCNGCISETQQKANADVTSRHNSSLFLSSRRLVASPSSLSRALRWRMHMHMHQDQDYDHDQHRDSIAMFSPPRTAVHLAQLPSRLTSPLQKHTFRPSPHHQCVRAVAQPFMQLPVHGLHLNCWPYRDTCRRNGDHGPATALACEALIN